MFEKENIPMANQIQGPCDDEKQLFPKKGESLPIQKYKDSAMVEGKKGGSVIESPATDKNLFKRK